MRLADRSWLTCCLGHDAADSWADVRALLSGKAAEIGAKASPEQPFAIGLSLSARAVGELADAEARYELLEILSRNDYRAVMADGRYPANPGTEGVPLDWRDPGMTIYITRLAELMAGIAPEGEAVSIATLPGAPIPETGSEDEEVIAANLLDAAALLIRLEESTGVPTRLAIQPEPGFLIGNSAQAVAFFERHLLSDAAVTRVVTATGMPAGDVASALPAHLGLCYDTGHAAVSFEDAGEALGKLSAAGVPIHRLQLSGALAVASVDQAAREALAGLDATRIVARRKDETTDQTKLVEALEAGSAADGEEWRIHCHLPCNAEPKKPLAAAADPALAVLERHRERPVAPHAALEVETTGDVTDAPPDAETLAAGLQWVRERLA